MAQTGRERHRDRDSGRRLLAGDGPSSPHRSFRISEGQRQRIAAECLRYIDEARRALQDQQNPDNREIIRELRASADRIFDTMNGLEELA